MRRKSLRMLSLALTAVMVLSVANPGVTALATEADSAIEQQAETTISEETTTEMVTEEATEAVATETATEEATEATTTETTAEAVTTEVATTETATTEETTEVVNSEEAESIESLVEDVPQTQLATVSSSALVSTVITNSTLFDMVLAAYNTGNGSSLTAAEFTVGDLSTYAGNLDFSGATADQIKAVTSVKGLGIAAKATSIDISAFTGVTAIEDNEFAGCAFESFYMPTSITSIGDQAFSGCNGLKSITLPNGLKSLGEFAFENCTVLASIHTPSGNNTLPTGLTSVGQKAFLNDAALKQITLPSFTNGSVLESAVGLFSGCTGLESVTVEKGVKIIPTEAFLSAGTTSVSGVTLTFNASSALEKIHSRAFFGINLATGTVDLSNCTKLTAIASEAFKGSTTLKTVILPATVSNGSLSLGDYVFAKSTLTALYPSGSSETGIYLPDYVSAVGAGAFYGNTVMTSVSLPSGLTEIADYLFDGCSALATVEQRQTNNSCAVTLIGDCAFRGTAITNTRFMLQMNNLKQIGRQLVETFSIGTAKEELEKVESLPLGGVEVDSKKKIDLSNPSNKKYGTNGTIDCGSEVFTNCNSLTEITIPASVQIIAQRAFYFPIGSGGESSTSSSLVTSVVWNKATGIAGLTRKIYPEAFHNNNRLATIDLPQNTGENLSIGAYAFSHNYALETIKCNGAANQKLPNTVSYIGTGAFRHGFSLKAVHIQAANGAAPELMPRVFENCISLATATLPAQITEIPYHFYAACPLSSFNFSDMTNVTLIDSLAFFGHQFTTIDLSKCANLQEIGAAAFAQVDNIKKTTYVKDEKKDFTLYAPEDPVLTTVKLPTTVAKTLYFNTSAFRGQSQFDTMGYANAITDNQVYIPDYVKKSSSSVFSMTGVSKVVWEADTASGNASMRWDAIPEYTFYGCTNLVNASDVSPKYIKSIGKRAFSESSLVYADLNGLTQLTKIGTGTLASGDSDDGAFMECPYLVSVTLPANVEGGIVVGEQTFDGDDSLTAVDLGAATTLEKEAFVDCIGLETIALKSVTDVGEKVFAGCSNLKAVDFGGVKSLGKESFKECTSLVLTGNPLPDTLETIKQGAFTEATALGKITFGSGLKTIEREAFKTAGVTELNFENAALLDTIGASAFLETNITDFTLEGTKVKSIEKNTLSGCESLKTATFGEEVEYVKEDAMAGCPDLKSLTFYASTTISQKVFYTKYRGSSGELITGSSNGTNTGTGEIIISVYVKTPAQTVIPLDREMAFPYYVNEKGTSNIQYLRVYDNNAKTDMNVEHYFTVAAEAADGYYKVTNTDFNNSNYKVSDTYFTKLDASQYKNVGTLGTAVDIIQVQGLEETESTRDLRFDIVASIGFLCADSTVSIKSDAFKATYNIKVADPGATASLYTDAKLQAAVSDTDARIQAVDGKKGATLYYYDVVDEINTGSTPDNYNIVIETDNPDVLYPGASATASVATSYTTTATTTSTNGTVTTKAANKKFYLIPASVGTANISVYSVNSQGQKNELSKRTYTFTVNSDVKSISLVIPSDYKSEAKPGDKFSVFDSYTNFIGQICSADNMLNFKKYTSQTIVFSSSDPEYASVDQLGNVKILKADGTAKRVKITATVVNSKGNTVSRYVTLNVKYPTVKNNTEVEDATTGSKVKVTKVSTTDLKGEVVYEGATDKATTSIVVPDSVTINGVKYKVTTISDGLFKNNTKVQSIKIGAYVEEIEEEAFSGCTSLKTVTIGNGVETIGEKAFYNCKKLTTVNLPSNGALKTIDTSAFQNCMALTKVTIPKSVEKIEAKAFYNCKKLKTVSMSSSGKLKSIGNSAFYNCVALTKITIPKAVEKIEDKAFYNCKKLKTVSISTKGKLQTIGASAFGKCAKLTKITLPSKVRSIGEKAFYNCKALKKITIKSTVLSSVGKNALKGIHKKAVIKVPKKKLAEYKTLLKGKGQKGSVKIKK